MPRQYSTGKRDLNEADLIQVARDLYRSPMHILKLREGQGADLLVTVWGNSFYVEVKSSPKEDLTDVEKLARTSITEAGGGYYIWRTLEDVQSIYEKQLAYERQI